jgi:hypothetical protein
LFNNHLNYIIFLDYKLKRPRVAAAQAHLLPADQSRPPLLSANRIFMESNKQKAVESNKQKATDKKVHDSLSPQTPAV